MAEAVFTLEQVAKMLNVSERTIMRQIKAGKLKGFKVGKSWRFREDAIDVYIAEQEATVPKDAASEEKSEDAA
jgi:excisionase family DNA binding protein